MLENAGAGTAINGQPDGTSAALDSLKPTKLKASLPRDVACIKIERKVLERLPRPNNAWIDILEVTSQEDCLYRACGYEGGVCRYTNDLWQAEIYASYHK